MSEDWSGEVKEPASYKLKPQEVVRLFNQACLLRDSISTLEQLLEIKTAIRGDDHTYARDLWDEMPDEEKGLLHVAPTKGGVFTVAEKKVLRNE